jgi:hypothetical protein
MNKHQYRAVGHENMQTICRTRHSIDFEDFAIAVLRSASSLVRSNSEQRWVKQEHPQSSN